MIKAEGLSFYHLYQIHLLHTFLYGIQLGSVSLHLARSFIQCHFSPVRSVHLPGNTECPVTLVSALPRWHTLSIQTRLSNYIYQLQTTV